MSADDPGDDRAAGLPGSASGPVAGCPEAGTGRGRPAEDAPGARDPPDAANRPRSRGGDDAAAAAAPPLRPARTDWLHHRLTVTGPSAELAALREAAAGAGIIPWRHDFDRLEEGWFHLLIAPPPARRSLSAAGCRRLATRLREAAERRHERALATVGRSRACPFDLHALIPVPDAVLALGPDDPAAIAWLWAHWGTTEALRHVATAPAPGRAGLRRTAGGRSPGLVPEARDPGGTPKESPVIDSPVIDSPVIDSPVIDSPVIDSWVIDFHAADWTPWRALATLRGRWPGLRLAARPTYGAA